MLIPTPLYERTRMMAKRLTTTITQIMRDALSLHVEHLETKWIADQKRQEATPIARRGFKPIRSTKIREESASRSESEPLLEEKPHDYEKYVDGILQAIHAGSPFETRLRTQEAITAIKKQNPLTCPDDPAIVTILEKLVMEKRQALTMEETGAGEDSVKEEIVIDPSKIKTRGLTSG